MRSGMQFWMGALALGLAMPVTAAAQLGQPAQPDRQPSAATQAEQQPAQTGHPSAGAAPRPLPGGGQQERANLVAMVNGEAITQSEFRNNVESTLQAQQRAGGPQPAPQDIQKIHQQVLDSLVESRLVEQHVLENGPKVEPGEVDAVLKGFVEQLQVQNLTLPDFLASTAQTEDHLRKRIEGSIAWQKFQREEMSPDNLRRFYEGHQQQFGAMTFEQAQHQVAQLYVQKLWSDIVAQMKPGAQIEIVRSQPATPQVPPEQPVR